VARSAGATVFAIVLTDGHLDDKVAARLGRAGADRVLCCEGAGLGGPPLDATHGHALHAAVERIPPLVVLFPAGGAGPELGPALAARLGAAFAASADLELGEAATPLADGIGRVFLRRWRRDRTSYRRLDPVELERPVVAILPAGGPPADIGGEAVEVDIIACPQPAKGGVVELASEADDTAAAALASTLIVVDPALGKDTLAALAAAAPPGVAVIDAVAAGTTLAVCVPHILISASSRGVAAMVTPRGRVGIVLDPGAPLPARSFADVLLRGDGKQAAASLWSELAARLAALAPPPAPGGAS
jgi:hypothetical protein